MQLVDSKTEPQESDFRWSDDGICYVYTGCSGYENIFFHIWHLQKMQVAKTRSNRMYQLRTLCGCLSKPYYSVRLADYARDIMMRRHLQNMNGTGMCRMWFLQLCLSGKETVETVNRFHEKDCSGESQKEKITREEEVNKSERESVKYIIFTTYT